MQLIRSPKAMQTLADQVRASGKRIGFVPTMGALHLGHLSLLEACRRHADFAVASIYVNPLQFGPKEDLAKYPRPLESDLEKCQQSGCDAVYLPDDPTMYPPGHEVTVVPGPLGQHWCGRFRPGHFRGVLTVVAKLFNTVKPHVAFFGQKDYQQALLIKRMVRDLDYDIEIVVEPTVREPDGLAMSSRNTYLSPEERQQARALSAALAEASRRIAAGERRAAAVRAALWEVLADYKLTAVEYAEVADADTLEPLTALHGKVALGLAARVGTTRLIDNMVLNVE